MYCTQSISRGKECRAGAVLAPVVVVFRGFVGDSARPDLVACASSGCFELCIEALVAVAAAGTDGLCDTNHYLLGMALSVVQKMYQQPGCEAKVRGIAAALAFCLEHPLEVMKGIGISTDASAAAICECTAAIARVLVASEQTITIVRVCRLQCLRQRRARIRVQFHAGTGGCSVRPSTPGPIACRPPATLVPSHLQ